MKDYNADRLQNNLRSVKRSAPSYRRTASVLVLKATMSGIAPHSALEL